jgi:hypothetical protein
MSAISQAKMKRTKKLKPVKLTRTKALVLPHSAFTFTAVRAAPPSGWVTIAEGKDEKKDVVEKPLLKFGDAFRLAIGDQTLDFVAHLKGSLASDGSGVLRGFIPMDPSLGVYLEYGSLSSLFDEVKLIESEVQLLPALSASGSQGAAPTFNIHNTLYAAFDRDAYNTSTASSDQVFRTDGSQCMSMLHGDNLPTIIRWQVDPRRGYCSTAVPTTIDPPAGCCGVLRYAAISTVSLSTTYYFYGVKNRYRFRNRV